MSTNRWRVRGRPRRAGLAAHHYARHFCRVPPTATPSGDDRPHSELEQALVDLGARLLGDANPAFAQAILERILPSEPATVPAPDSIFLGRRNFERG